MQNPHWAAPVSEERLLERVEPVLAGQALDGRQLARRPPRPRASGRSRRSAPSTRTVHAPHSPTRQHSFVPVSPRSSRRTSSSVWCGGDLDRARARPLTVRSIRRVAVIADACRREALDRDADGPQAEDVQHRETVLGTRPHRARGRAGIRRTALSSRSIFARSAAAGSASSPVSSATRTGRGPRLPYASRVAPSAGTAQASVTEARSWPRRRVRRTWTDAARPIGERQLDGRDQLSPGRAS